MGVIMHKNILYGGGSTIEPNPQESATEQLEKLCIDGDVYEVTDANAIHTSDVGVANGVAELDANGKVPSSQLPSYVDDVLEYASRSAFPATGETGKIYVALDTNLTYRWGGSDYVEISPSLALGETSSTAYRGDRGKIAYDHSQSDHSGIKPAFTEASTRANIASGESFATLLGKIKKFFSDLKDLAFIGKDGTSSTKYLRGDGTWQNFPTIPTVNDATLTIQKNGTAVETFTANSSTNKTANITVPTKTSDLNNDSGFVTTDEKVTGEEKNWDTGYWMNVPFIGTSNQKPYYNDGQRYYTKNGTSSAVGRAILAMGNSTASGTAGNKRGEIWVYGENDRVSMLRADSLTGDRTIFLPDKNGIIALMNYVSFTLNSSTSAKWYYVLSRTYNLGASAEFIVQVANTNFSNTSGTTKLFLLHMHYREMLIKPLSADDSQVDWIKNWRITRDDSKMYLEFQAQTITSAATNDFQITFIPLNYNGAVGVTIPSSITESVGTTTMHTYTVDANFRAAKNGDVLPLSGGSMTGQLTLAQTGYKTYSAHGYAVDEAGNFAHTDSNAAHWFHLDNQAKTMSLKYYWETGKLYVPADIYANGDKQVITSPLYATGSVGSGKTGSQVIAQITLPEAGTYYITGWARFTGSGKKAVWLWCEGSLSESWEDSTIASGEPKTFSTFAIYTASAAGKVVQVDSYTVSASNAVTGGLVAFKIA